MRRFTLLAIMALLAVPAPSSAQDTGSKPATSSALTTLAGVYTEQQASKGESIYTGLCLYCHDEWDHTGPAFKQNWDTRTAFDLFETIRTTMPNDDPGRLPREDYASIVAYLFKVNKMPSGRKPLPSDMAGLKQIVISVSDAPPQR
jgi:hypothetical protein